MTRPWPGRTKELVGSSNSPQRHQQPVCETRLSSSVMALFPSALAWQAARLVNSSRAGPGKLGFGRCFGIIVTRKSCHHGPLRLGPAGERTAHVERNWTSHFATVSCSSSVHFKLGAATVNDRSQSSSANAGLVLHCSSRIVRVLGLWLHQPHRHCRSKCRHSTGTVQAGQVRSNRLDVLQPRKYKFEEPSCALSRAIVNINPSLQSLPLQEGVFGASCKV